MISLLILLRNRLSETASFLDPVCEMGLVKRDDVVLLLLLLHYYCIILVIAAKPRVLCCTSLFLRSSHIALSCALAANAKVYKDREEAHVLG